MLFLSFWAAGRMFFLGVQMLEIKIKLIDFVIFPLDYFGKKNRGYNMSSHDD